MEELSKKIDPIMVELNKAYKEKYPNKGYLDKRILLMNICLNKLLKFLCLSIQYS